MTNKIIENTIDSDEITESLKKMNEEIEDIMYSIQWEPNKELIEQIQSIMQNIDLTLMVIEGNGIIEEKVIS